jgi:hypothetical protein
MKGETIKGRTTISASLYHCANQFKRLRESKERTDIFLFLLSARRYNSSTNGNTFLDAVSINSRSFEKGKREPVFFASLADVAIQFKYN